MGEAAEDMLDGTCCEGCGEFFDDILDGKEPPGHPRRCSACQPSRDWSASKPSRSARRRAQRQRAAARAD